MKRVVALIVGIALALPGMAFASSSSTCQAYNSQLCNSVSPTTAARTTAASTGTTLPFTGLDVLLLGAGGAVLLGSGLVVRRFSRDAD